MPVYRDDAVTGEDDGADPGDRFRFSVNHLPAVPMGPDDTVWTANGDLFHVNLFAGPLVHRILFLAAGWNLVSFDVMPVEAAVTSVFAPIADKYERVLSFDCNSGAQSHYAGLPAELNTLETVDAWHGYWVKMKEGAHLVLVGVEIPDGTTIPLCAGFNLVGYLPDEPLQIDEALVSAAGRYEYVITFDPLEGPMSHYPELPQSINTLTRMEPGYGYWIKMPDAGLLVYP